MGDEQIFAKARAVATDHRIDRDTGEIAELRQGVRRERQSDQCGPQFRDREAELLRDAIAEGARTDLRNRQSAAGDDQRRAFEHTAVGGDCETFAFFNRGDLGRHAPLHLRVVAFGPEHFDDLQRGPVAEQLAELLLVPGDAMLFHQRDEVARRVARQRGAAEIGVRGKKILRPCIDVGEIAASAARDADFFAQLFGVVEQQHAAAAFAGFDRAHHAGPSGADDDDVGAHRTGFPCAKCPVSLIRGITLTLDNSKLIHPQ